MTDARMTRRQAFWQAQGFEDDMVCLSLCEGS